MRTARRFSLLAANICFLALSVNTASWAQSSSQTAPQQPAASAPASVSSPFLEQVTAHFVQWDSDHDGTLSEQEVDKAVSDPQTTGKSAAAIVALKRSLRSKTFTPPALTLDNITRCIPMTQEMRGKQPDYEALYMGAWKRIQSIKRDLFVSGSPNLDTLHQGRLGDCFCLAPLGAMLHRDPQDVVKMFQANADGTILVQFGNKKRVSLSAPTDAEIALTSSSSLDGVWVNLYEKAVGICRKETLSPDSSASPLDVLGKGGSAGTMVAFVTGHQIKRFSCTPLRKSDITEPQKQEGLERLRGMLTEAMQNKRLVCAGTGAGVKVPGVTSNHAYAILDYDPTIDWVTLWNPHGNTYTPHGEAGLEHGYTTAKGQFRVPLTQAVQFLAGFSFETNQPLKN